MLDEKQLDKKQQAETHFSRLTEALKDRYLDRFFICAASMMLLAGAIVLAGNPLIDGWLPWHFFPEMTAIFFFGCFLAVKSQIFRRINWRFVAGVFLLGSFASNLSVNVFFGTLRQNFLFDCLVTSMLAAPVLVGYAVEKRRLKRRVLLNSCSFAILS
jgi:peptidoglycan/LPS O-acetylase OafA/YrhL